MEEVEGVDKVVVACVQERMRIPQSVEEYRGHLERFMRAARNKHARLVIFPELAGLLLGAPMLDDARSSLIKRADQGRRRNASLWQRLSGSVANSLAGMTKADLRVSLAALLDTHADELWDLYQDTFSSLARDYGVTLVAPSAYLPDPLDGVIRNLSGVFGPGGELLGVQAKVMLHAEDQDLVQPGVAWDVIQTEVGALGVLIGNDALYPEVGRVLAYQGAEILIGQAACPNPALYNKVRAGMLSRMQDNQIFAVISFLVGRNELSRVQREPFVGRSAIFAPQELTPRFSGVLVEMGNQNSEGVLTAEWDFVALRDLWESSDTPVRQQLPFGQMRQVLGKLYAQLQEAPREDDDARLLASSDSESSAEVEDGDVYIELDDLSVFASVTSRWPLGEASLDHETDAGLIEAPVSPPPRTPSPIGPDDETDEMDAV
jgi:predicted amidohydrolase